MSLPSELSGARRPSSVIVVQKMKTSDAVIAALRSSAIPHAVEITAGLADGTVHLHDADLQACSCAELRSTYAIRSRNPELAKSSHGRRLKEECIQLAAALAQHPKERCFVVIFEKEPNISFGVFALEGVIEILGCTRSYDRRKTPDHQWEEIWSS